MAITIHGVITLLSPLHSSAGHHGLRLTRDGAVSSGKDGVMIMSTLSFPLSIRGRYWGRLPIFPSSSIIGAVRRAAAKRMRAALVADEGGRMSQTLYYALTQGQPAQAQISSTVTSEFFDAVHGNMFFGTFGGASIRNAAAFVQADLLPITDQTVDANLVPERFADLSPGANPDPRQLVDYRLLRRTDDLKRGRDRSAGKSVEREATELQTETAVAYQVVPPGISLYWRCQIKVGLTPEQKGLLVLALMDVLAEGQIGARAHLGWGNFAPQRWRYVDGSERMDLFDLRQDEDGITQFNVSEACKSLTAPADRALAAIGANATKEREALELLLKGQVPKPPSTPTKARGKNGTKP